MKLNLIDERVNLLYELVFIIFVIGFFLWGNFKKYNIKKRILIYLIDVVLV